MTIIISVWEDSHHLVGYINVLKTMIVLLFYDTHPRSDTMIVAEHKTLMTYHQNQPGIPPFLFIICAENVHAMRQFPHSCHELRT
jgi:hypothetical protein